MDKVVLPEESVKMVSAINSHGGNAKLAVFSDDHHNSWDSAFGMDETWEWLFTHKKER